jgi:ubiquinol oxidase
VALCVMLDKLFDETQPVQRFWFLETVARMPYFSYTSMLTFYEILGWWRRSSELRKVHFAEEWNEYHHLLVMESLGGDARWRDRFLGQHAAVVYFFVLVALWLISPALAYNFSELIEGHAVDTYAQFCDQNADILKTMPAPPIAREYYEADDLYLFDEIHTSNASSVENPGSPSTDAAREVRARRPRIKSLYDVFCNIRDDEGEHVSTMNACQREDSDISSPNAVNAKTAAVAALLAAQYAFQKVAETALTADEFLDVDAVMDEKVLSAGVFDTLLRLFDFL